MARRRRDDVHRQVLHVEIVRPKVGASDGGGGAGEEWRHLGGRRRRRGGRRTPCVLGRRIRARTCNVAGLPAAIAESSVSIRRHG